MRGLGVAAALGVAGMVDSPPLSPTPKAGARDRPGVRGESVMGGCDGAGPRPLSLSIHRPLSPSTKGGRVCV